MTGNLFTPLPRGKIDEVFETLVRTDGLTLERIVSRGQATPAGTWLDQDRDEWVLLASGEAGLLLDGESEVRTLRTGDYLLIPARRKHRVEWTAADKETVWLALHFVCGARSGR